MHCVHTAPRRTLFFMSVGMVKRIVCTFGYTQRFTLLLALLTILATRGFFVHIVQIFAIVDILPLKSVFNIWYQKDVFFQSIFRQ